MDMEGKKLCAVPGCRHYQLLMPGIPEPLPVCSRRCWVEHYRTEEGFPSLSFLQ